MEYSGTVIEIGRNRSSSMGNPSWNLYIVADGLEQRTFRTSANISDAYAIDNGWVDRRVVFTLTRAGRIATIRLAD